MVVLIGGVKRVAVWSFYRRLFTSTRPICSHCGVSHFKTLTAPYINDHSFLRSRKVEGVHGFVNIDKQKFGTSAVRLTEEEGTGKEEMDAELEALLNEEISRTENEDEYFLPGEGHKVFLIQPDLRYVRREKDPETSVDHQLEESVTLVYSLPKWVVGETSIERVRSLKSREMFGKGTLEALSEKIRQHPECTAIYVNVPMLSGYQLSHLQKLWRRPVYDRFTIVLQIFKIRARTKEARLQVALAQIPYFRSRLVGMHLGTLDQQKGGTSYIGGAGETQLELRHRMLKHKELKIKRALSRLKENRQRLRENRVKRECPTVAVVGYTNAGKTSLIKSLTEDANMIPRDQLFATLDVTVHAGLLPSHLKVLYVDTVGFISDIPTSLIASFSATLEDAISADLIVHVRDISHPDTDQQRRVVLDTLRGLNEGGTEGVEGKIIEVCNKVDKVSSSLHSSLIPEGAVGISATVGYGIDALLHQIEEKAIENTGRVIKYFKVPMNGPHLSWLYKEATVQETKSCDSDPESLLVRAVLTQAAYGKFLSQFSKKQKKTLQKQQT